MTEAKDQSEGRAKKAEERTAELEVAVVKLETQLAERTASLEELRASHARFRRSGDDLRAEAESQFKSMAGAKAGSDVAAIEKKLQFAEERAEQHTQDAKLWKTLLATHKADLKAAQTEVEGLRGEIAASREQLASHAGQGEKAQQREADLQTKIDDLSREVTEL